MDSIISHLRQAATRAVDFTTFGRINSTYRDNMVILNYKEECQFDGKWNQYEKVCRGLILATDHEEVIAHPFAKFFNYSSQGLPHPDASLVNITEKLDGSLGILYRQDGQYKIATRGSFTSDQALWATEFLRRYDVISIPDHFTFLFEIIYPNNKIVVDYKGREDLVLIGVINRISGYDYHWGGVEDIGKIYNFPLPIVYHYNNADEMLTLAKSLSVNQEGWVLRYSDGSRYKVKGDAYVEMHRLISNLSFRHVLAAYAQGDCDGYITRLPDELHPLARQWQKEIIDEESRLVDEVWQGTDKHRHLSRKDFALWVQKEHKEHMALYFTALDGRNVHDLVMKRFDENNCAKW